MKDMDKVLRGVNSDVYIINRLKFVGLALVLVALVISSVGMAPQRTALAQGDDPVEEPLLISIIGVVEIVLPDSIVVSGVIVYPEGVFDPADLNVGDIVIVTGYLMPDDTLEATAFEIAPEGIVLPTAPEDPGDEPVEDPGDDPAPEPEDTTTCADYRDDQPVALSLAAEFEEMADYDTIMGWHCEGIGFGEIARALLIEETDGTVTAQELLDRFAAGEGWGEIKKDFDVSPSDLAPGRVIAADKVKNIPPGQAKKDQNEEQEQEQTQEQQQAGPGQSQNNPGHSGAPPGQTKDKKH